MTRTPFLVSLCLTLSICKTEIVINICEVLSAVCGPGQDAKQLIH
jgi:hypothetical protein